MFYINFRVIFKIILFAYSNPVSTYTDFKYLRQVSHLLRNFKEVEQYKYNFSCPICGDSKKCSWKSRGYVYLYEGKTFFHCHNCGDSKPFSTFLKYVDEIAWREWIKETKLEDPYSKSSYVNQKKTISQKKEVYENMIKLSDLPQDHSVFEYLESRQIPKSRYPILYFTNNFRELVEEVFPGKGGKYPEDERLVLPIYNQKSELVGITGRSTIGSKIRYALAKSDDQKCFFGLERINFDKPVFVLEGPMDALFMPNAVAVCHSDLGMFPRAFTNVKSILVFDNEPENPEIVKIMKKAITEGYNICIWDNCPFIGKDINEMIQNGANLKDLLSFILNNTYKGSRADFKIIEWKRNK